MIRCRFAPSPTGYLHVGGARAALYNWYFARQQGGEFLLRIEDTDAERNRPELTDNILDMLRWLDLAWDGDVVHQSDRLDLYAGAAATLHANGAAYYCDCSADDVKRRHEAAGGKPGYDGYCRGRGLEPGPGRALRFHAPDEGTTSFADVIRGEVSIANDTIEDFVLLRSNGTPTFLLANIVDDADTGITHVLRGEEHVNGTPKYLLLGEALGLDYRPVFAHLPILVNEQRKKLSKRRDDVSMQSYKEQGYLPEAMSNYLTLLGWGPPDGVEVRQLDEFVALFRLEDVNPSPAFFDIKKLGFVNGEWIRLLAPDDFVSRAEPFLSDADQVAALHALGPLAQERTRVLHELPEYFDWINEPADDQRSWDKAMKLPLARDVLGGIIDSYADAPWERDELHARFIALAELLETSPSKVQGPIRVAVTGRVVGLPLFEILEYLGRDEVLSRLRVAAGRLQ